MADPLYRHELSRRHLLRGATTLAMTALVAACGQEPATPPLASSPIGGTLILPIVATPLAPPTAPLVRPPAPSTTPPTTPLLVFIGASNSLSRDPSLHQSSDPGVIEFTVGMLAPTRYDAVNLGQPAQTLTQVNAAVAPTIDAWYAPTRSKNIFVAYGGSNDLVLRYSVDETFLRLASACDGRRRTGFKVVVATILPRADVTGYLDPTVFETERQEYNARIRMHYAAFADGLADAGADRRVGVAGAVTDPQYYLSDGTLTEATNRINAEIVTAAIRKL